MRVFIPTRGRYGEQHTLAALLDAGVDAWLVVDPDDEPMVSASYPNKIVLDKPGGIGDKRQAVLDLCQDPKLVMVDDDVRFHTVQDGRTWSSTPSEVSSLFALIEETLDQFAHGGVHSRLFVNQKPQPYVNSRSIYRQILCYNRALMPEVPRFSGNEGDEDTRYFLSLLDLGLEYFVITKFCFSERRSRVLPSHFSDSFKRQSTEKLVSSGKYAPYARRTRFGHTLDFPRILADAKRRRWLAGAGPGAGPGTNRGAGGSGGG